MSGDPMLVGEPALRQTVNEKYVIPMLRFRFGKVSPPDMDLPMTNDPDEFRRNALALRRAAEGMIHQESRRQLLQMAEAFDAIADRLSAQWDAHQDCS